MAHVHSLSRKPGYHDLRQHSRMSRYLHLLGDICNHIRSRHHGQSGHIRHSSLHKPLPSRPQGERERDWLYMETSLVPWNVDRAAPDTEYRPAETGNDIALDNALSALNPTSTEQTHTTVIWQPAVTHATNVVQPYEITRQTVDREVHHYHYIHRTLPVSDFQILPAKHFVENSRGSYTEVSREPVPLDTDDEYELLRVIDDSARKEARAQMSRIEAEPTPTPSHDHFYGEQQHQDNDQHNVRCSRASKSPQPFLAKSRLNAKPSSTQTLWEADQRTDMNGNTDNDPQVVTGLSSRDATSCARQNLSPAPVVTTSLPDSPEQQKQAGTRPTQSSAISRFARRTTPFFAQPGNASEIPASSSARRHNLREPPQSTAATTSEKFIRPENETGLNSSRMARDSQPPSIATLMWPSQQAPRYGTEHGLNGSMSSAAPIAESGSTRSAESAPSRPTASRGLWLDYNETCPSCGAPKLATNPASPSSISTTDNATSSAATMSIVAETKDSRTWSVRPESLLAHAESASPAVSPMANVYPATIATAPKTSVPATKPSSTLITAYTTAADKMTLPASYARAAGSTSQP